MDYLLIGRRIRHIRKSRKLTQEELAELAEISAPFIGHIERGTRKMSLETLHALALALDVSCDYLLGMEDRKAADPTIVQKTIDEVVYILEKHWNTKKQA